MNKTTVEFEFDLADKVIIPGLNNAVGYVVSLWYSDRGAKYEVAFYCAGERKEDYFLAVELKLCDSKKDMGFKKEKP